MGRRTLWATLLSLTAALGVATAVTVVPTTAEGTAGRLVDRRTVSCRTDTAGYCSVTHAMGMTPTDIEVSPRIPAGKKAYTLSVVPGSETTTTFAVRALRPDGTPKSTSTIRFTYWAYGDPSLPEPTTSPTTTSTVPTTSAPTTTVVPTTTAPRISSAPTTTSAPSTTGNPAAVCGTDVLNGGPTTAPTGAVVVPAGHNSAVDFGRPDTTYWFAPGVHTLGSGQYSQIVPGDNATFVGAPGAVLDGQRVNNYAFTQHATNVKIRYLTIRNFVAPQNEGVVNHDSGDGWLIERNTITLNKGAAMMSGARQKVIGNCLKDNGQYGLNAYKAGNTITDIVVEGNEFVGNNTDDWESKIAGCGCTGAMKFWAVNRADIRANWIHDNRGPGIWADTNNNDFLVEDNLIEANDSHAIFYEISYNIVIRNNTLRNNAWVTGKEFASSGDTFPIGAVYLSETVGDSRIPARTASVELTGNVLENNWGGIVGWENSDRFCNSPASTTDDCTLIVGPANTSKCSQPGIASEPLHSNCRWKTQNLDIHHNKFVFDPAKVAGGCPTTYCGQMALFANYGTYPDWSPYKGRKIQEAITFQQRNRWHDNTYIGSWRFVPYETGRVLTFAQWRAAPYNQDAGSS